MNLARPLTVITPTVDADVLAVLAGCGKSAVARRIAIFLEQTMKVLDHYRSHGIVHRVDGDQPVDQIWAELLAILIRRRPALAAS